MSIETDENKVEEQKAASLLERTGIPAVKEEKKEETTTEPTEELETQETEQETQEPESESSAEENTAEEEDTEEYSKGVQKRINKEVRKRKEEVSKRKEAEELAEANAQRVAELENKLKALEDKPVEDSQYALSQEEQAKLMIDKAKQSIMEADKDKPLKDKRLLTDEEANELMLDNPHAYQKYLQKEGKLVNDLQNEVNKVIKPPKAKEEPKEASKDLYKDFVGAYPDLDFQGVWQEVSQKVDREKDPDKFVEMVKEKNSEVGEFFAFMEENQAKYAKETDLRVVARDYYADKKEKSYKSLEERLAKAEAELARRDGLDNGVSSTVDSKGQEPKSKEDKELEKQAARILGKLGINK